MPVKAMKAPLTALAFFTSLPYCLRRYPAASAADSSQPGHLQPASLRLFCFFSQLQQFKFKSGHGPSRQRSRHHTDQPDQQWGGQHCWRQWHVGIHPWCQQQCHLWLSSLWQWQTVPAPALTGLYDLALLGSCRQPQMSFARAQDNVILG